MLVMAEICKDFRRSPAEYFCHRIPDLFFLILCLSSAALAAAPPGTAVRINCGGTQFVDPVSGNVWLADQDFSGGVRYTAPADILQLFSTLNAKQPPQLYGTSRQWPDVVTGQYKIQLPGSPGGLYWVRLHWAELQFSNTSDRRFGVNMNGFQFLSQYNAPAPATAFVEEFSLPIIATSNNSLTLQLTRGPGSTVVPYLCGIEVLPQPATQYRDSLITTMALRTVARLACGANASFSDSSGRTWNPDSPDFYTNPNTTAVTVKAPLAGTDTPINYIPARLFQSERVIVPASLTPSGLTIPVAVTSPSYHLLRIYFAEIDAAEPGQRILDLYLNGQLMFSGLDVAKLAGLNTGTFVDLNAEADPSTSTILLSIVPNAASPLQEPKLNGLEVFQHLPLLLPETPEVPGTIRINCGAGADFTDAQGRLWSADRFFSGGTRIAPSPATAIAFAASRLQDVELYGSYRTWKSGTVNSYSIPVDVSATSLFSVRLYFAELQYTNTSERSFTVAINGLSVLINYNTALPNNTYQFAYSVPVFSNQVNITLIRNIADPYINAIEILPQPPGQYHESIQNLGPTVLGTVNRINFGGDGLMDGQERFWARDGLEYFGNSSASQNVYSTVPISGTNATSSAPGAAAALSTSDQLPQGLYKSQRAVVPTAFSPSPSLVITLSLGPSSLFALLRMHFADFWFSNPGDRVMDISVNGQNVILGLDVIKEAGGPNAALHRDVFLQLSTTAQNLTISITGNAAGRYSVPMISGLEVILALPWGRIPEPTNGTVRINCGGPSLVDLFGRAWLSDQYFSEGGKSMEASPRAVSLFYARGNQEEVYLTNREWPAGAVGTYSVPVTPGMYMVRLLFCGLSLGSSANRSLSATIGGYAISNTIDIGVLNLQQFEYNFFVHGERLNITLFPLNGTVMVSAIEVMPLPPTQYRGSIVGDTILTLLYRQNAGGLATADEYGREWLGDGSDTYTYPSTTRLSTSTLFSATAGANRLNLTSPSVGGSGAATAAGAGGDGGNVEGGGNLGDPADEALPPTTVLATQRVFVGNASTGGKGILESVPTFWTTFYYLLRLYFVELEFRVPGDRVVDIYANDQLLYSGFDIVNATAGVPGAPVFLDFLLQAQGQGGDVPVRVVPSSNSKSKEPVLNAFELFRVTPTSRIDTQAEQGIVRINCGGPDYLSPLNQLWVADRFFLGGDNDTVGSHSLEADLVSQGYSDFSLYTHLRRWEEVAVPPSSNGSTATNNSSSIGYSIPLENTPSIFIVRLLFGELTTTNASANSFSLFLNKVKLLSDFHVLNATGEYFFEFIMHIDHPLANITFIANTGVPYINAIEIILAPHGLYQESLDTTVVLTRLVRVTCGGPRFVDEIGRAWDSDSPGDYSSPATSVFTTDAPLSFPASSADKATGDASTDQSPLDMYRTERRVLPGDWKRALAKGKDGGTSSALDGRGASSPLSSKTANSTLNALEGIYNSSSNSSSSGNLLLPTLIHPIVVPTANSLYLLRLHFAEIVYNRTGDRVLDIFVNERPVRLGLDMVRDYGANIAFFLDFTVSANASTSPTTITVEVRSNRTGRHLEPKLSGYELFFMYPQMVAPPPLSGTIRINCGSSEDYYDEFGKLWSADKFFIGGEAVPPTPAALALLSSAVSTDIFVFSSYRRWRDGLNCTYSIPVAGGQLFWVRLYFAELELQSTFQRTYAVSIDGFLVIGAIQLPAVGNGFFGEFLVPLPGPNVSIVLTRSIGDPIISAIEIVPASSGQYNQTVTSRDILYTKARFTCGGTDVMDKEGKIWHFDSPAINYTNAVTAVASTSASIAGTDESPEFLPDAVYQSERQVLAQDLTSSGLSFVFLVGSGGTFFVRLHFAEFEYSNPGDRILDIYLNDKLVLEGLDVIAEAGVDTVLFKDFTLVNDVSTYVTKVAVQPNNKSRVKAPKLNAFEMFTVLPGPVIILPVAATPSSPFPTWAIIVIALSSSLLLLLFLIALLGWRRRAKRQYEMGVWYQERVSGPGGKELMAMLNDRSVRFIPLRELEKATDKFSDANKLGAGGFGTVYRGQQNGVEWAVKRAKKASQQDLAQFADEVDLISQLNHVNLIRLYGFCTERGEQILVYEFAPNGTLYDFLHPKPGKQIKALSFEERLSIALGAARGLNYLHSFAQQPVIHRDVKSENILLGDGMQAKVADFGLLKRIDKAEGDEQATAKIAGTRGYMDPEYFTTFKVTTKSDVYGFGVLLLEIVTGRPPILVDPEDNEETKSLVAWVKVKLAAGDWKGIPDARLGLNFPETSFREVVKVGLACVQQYGNDRPSMAMVVSWLEEIATDEVSVDINEVPLVAPIDSSELDDSELSGHGPTQYGSVIMASKSDGPSFLSHIQAR